MYGPPVWSDQVIRPVSVRSGSDQWKTEKTIGQLSFIKTDKDCIEYKARTKTGL